MGSSIVCDKDCMSTCIFQKIYLLFAFPAISKVSMNDPNVDNKVEISIEKQRLHFVYYINNGQYK